MTSVNENVAQQRLVVERIAKINLDASNPPTAHTDASYQIWSRDGQSVIGAFVLWLIVSLMLWLTARVGLRPLGKLAATLATRKENDFAPMNSAAIHTELKPLVATIDARNHAVQSMMSREREFFADAAHELRTPLAALEAQAHVLASATSVLERQTALVAMESGVQRCASSLDKLLLLARIDAHVTDCCHGQLRSTFRLVMKVRSLCPR